MEKYYHIKSIVNSKSIIEIQVVSPSQYRDIEQYLLPTSNIKIPHGVEFEVKKGKRWTDVIVYHQSVSLCFFSQKLMDVLGQFVDVDNYSYPIHIVNCPHKYYVLFNLPQVPFINSAYCPNQDEDPYFVFSHAPLQLFTLADTNLKVCSSQIMDMLVKSKMTNIAFRDVYELTNDEYKLWVAEHES